MQHRVAGWMLVAALVLSPTSSPAQDAARGLTVYYGDFALVRQRVDRILEPGDVTVRVDGLPTGFDAASLVVLNPEVELLGAHGQLTYEGSGEAGASLALDLRVTAPARRLDLAFISRGLGWSASYNLLVDPDDTRGRIEGFAEIYNRSGVDFEAVSAQLLAGEVRFQEGGRPRGYEMMAAARMAAEAAPELSQQGFAGYHLYDVSQPLDLRTGSSRRIRLLGDDAVALRRELRVVSDVNVYDRQVDPERRPVAIRYRLTRPRGGEFGDTPLPAGPVRVLQRDPQGRAQLLGVASIADTPAGDDLVLPVGDAFDIVLQRQQTAYDRLSRELAESAWQLQLRNEGLRAATVEVVERIPGDWSLMESSRQPESTTARAMRFVVEVPAGGSVDISYRVQIRG